MGARLAVGVEMVGTRGSLSAGVWLLMRIFEPSKMSFCHMTKPFRVPVSPSGILWSWVGNVVVRRWKTSSLEARGKLPRKWT